MPKTIALIDYSRCGPEYCDSGMCNAVSACPYELLVQETAYEAPMPRPSLPSLCQGCAKCVVACPSKAVQLN